MTYAFTKNQGPARNGTIRFDWVGGSVTHQVQQAATNFAVSVQMFDPFRSINATTNCQIRSAGAANTCNLVATAVLPAVVTSYAWTASYVYGTTTKSPTQTGTSNTLAITDQCGLAGSSAEGTVADLTVSLTVTNGVGNTQTYSSTAGQFRMTFYTCGT